MNGRVGDVESSPESRRPYCGHFRTSRTLSLDWAGFSPPFSVGPSPFFAFWVLLDRIEVTAGHQVAVFVSAHLPFSTDGILRITQQVLACLPACPLVCGRHLTRHL